MYIANVLYHGSHRTSNNWRLLVPADHGITRHVQAQGYCEGGQQSSALLRKLRRERQPVQPSVTILIGTNDLLKVSPLLSRPIFFV